MQLLEAAWQRVPPSAAFTGMTSLWLHRVGVDPCDPIEVLLPPGAGVSQRAGLAIRRSAFSASEIVLARGLRAASVERAMLDVCCTRSLVEATVVADAALHAGRTTVDQLLAWTRLNPRRHGIRKLRRVVELAEPASESPMESRLRLALVLGGLPRPRVQVKVRDARGAVVGRIDLYYEAARLGIEYDGSTHRDSLADDDRRQNALLVAGITLLRFTSRDVYRDPQSVLRQVRALLNETSAGRSRGQRHTGATSAGRTCT